MTDEEAVIADAESIIASAIEQEEKDAETSANESLLMAEEAAWKEMPVKDAQHVYDVWVFTREFTGTPEQLAEYRKQQESSKPDAKMVDSQAWLDGRANACIGLQPLFISDPEKTPPNIKDVLADPNAIMAIHTAPNLEGCELEGLMIRTQAHAKKTEDDESPLDIVITVALLGEYMAIIPRIQETGEILTKPNFVKVVRYQGEGDRDNGASVQECWGNLAETHGEVAHLLYGALYLPKVTQHRDPEMWVAMKQDFLARQAGEGDQE